MALPRVRGAALLAIAALVGLLVSLVLIYTVERRAAVATVPVLVVTKTVTKGIVLEAGMMEVVQWPSHLKNFDALKTAEKAVGRLARVDLYAGEPLLEAKLRPRGERGDLNDQLGVGERALSVRVNDIAGVPVESVLEQNVDLLLTNSDGEAGVSSRPVAERIKVLAVNDTGSTDRPQPIRMLTVAVTPEQAAAIEKSRIIGELTALVRNPRDRRTVTRSDTESRNAVSGGKGGNGASTGGPRSAEWPDPAPRRVAPLKKPDEIELIVGSDSESVRP